MTLEQTLGSLPELYSISDADELVVRKASDGSEYRITRQQLQSGLLNETILGSLYPGQGSSLVGDSSGATVHDLLPVHLQFATYADLKAYTRPPPVTRVQITDANRGGTFRWQSGDQSAHITNDPDEVLWIAPNADATGASGAWKRETLDQATIYATWAGVIFDGVTDNTKAFENATALIQNEFINGKGTLVLNGDGRALAQYITLKSGINIVGQGSWLTCEIGPVASSQTEFIQLAHGYVENVEYRNFSIVGGNSGPVNAGQYALGIEAVDDGSGKAGLWYALFQNMRIVGFDNIWRFKGGDTLGPYPNQFITFINVYCQRHATTGYAINATGQNDQFTFINCKMDGPGPLASAGGTNMWLHWTAANDAAPVDWTFINCTSQMADYAIQCVACKDINFYGGWFENIKYGADAENTTSNLNFFGFHFANTGSDGSSGGYVCKLGYMCTGGLHQCSVGGSFDHVMDITNAKSSKCDVTLVGTPAVAFYVAGLYTDSVKSTNDVAIRALDEVAIRNPNSYALATINDDHPPQARIFIHIVDALDINSSGNIILGQRTSPVSIPAISFITLYKRQDNGRWLLESVN